MCPHLSLSPPPSGNPLASPSCLSVCRSAPALRDEREEPLALAGGHHHHCDWCHSDRCLGDSGSFAEQAPRPKVQGMFEENTKSDAACSLCESARHYCWILVQCPQAKYGLLSM